QNKNGTIITHPNEERIGITQEFEDGYLAKVFGGYYTINSNEFVGPAIVGKAPILSESGEVLGVVSVGYLKEKVYKAIYKRVDDILYFSIIVIVIGVIASILLARHIRKDTFGLEPREIATLY